MSREYGESLPKAAISLDLSIYPVCTTIPFHFLSTDTEQGPSKLEPQPLTPQTLPRPSNSREP